MIRLDRMPGIRLAGARLVAHPRAEVSFSSPCPTPSHPRATNRAMTGSEYSCRVCPLSGGHLVEVDGELADCRPSRFGAVPKVVAFNRLQVVSRGCG